MTSINIGVKRTGFPVKIGEVELWFDSSIENLRRFFNIEEIAQDKLKKAQEKAKHIHFPDIIEDYEVLDLNESELKNVDAAIDVKNEFIAAQYDIIFGDDMFKGLYKVYPDILALESALEPIAMAIAKKIEEQESERSAKVDGIKNEALKKQKEKQK